MERRTALAIAAATAATVMAGSAAFAANIGLLQRDETPPISVLDTSAVSAETPVEPTVVTVVVEDPPLTAGGPAAVAPTSGSPTASFDDHGDDDSTELDDHGDDDEGDELEDHGDDDSRDDSSEYGSDEDQEEGHDDDD